MNMNRRSFFKGVAISPIATAVGLPAVAATAEATAAPAITAAASYPWVWWLSFDGGEEYRKQFATKEEALAALAEYDDKHALIAECRQQDFDLRVDFNDLWTAMYSRNEELMGEGGEFIDDITREQKEELEATVNAAIYAWAEKHKINKPAWIFGGVRNEIRAADARPLTITANGLA